MEIAPGNRADQLLEKGALKTAILMFSSFLAKLGKLDLDVNLILSRQMKQFWCFKSRL